jgi:hypothetical protein
MPLPNAAKSGTFAIGGDITVNRLGFGAMRVTGRGIWGEPEDRAEAIRTLERLLSSALISSTLPILVGLTFRKSSSAKFCIPTRACGSPPRAG